MQSRILIVQVTKMNRKNYLKTRIVHIEWEMFQKVTNIGGRASCQEDYTTFRINRHSQAESLSEAALESYLEDLEKAKGQGRNLLSEKYARMMASTSPSEYERLKHLLPPLEKDILSLVDQIACIVIEWQQEMAKKYARIMKRGRPIFSSQDTLNVTSFETYLQGELFTYSKKTLEHVYNDYLKLKSENINGFEIILDYMTKQYGYASLEAAEHGMSPEQKGQTTKPEPK